jgi:hypothetical protein
MFETGTVVHWGIRPKIIVQGVIMPYIQKPCLEFIEILDT